MEYEIKGKTVPCVEITLNRGESMYSQTGGMSWQTNGITMKTNARGGIFRSIGRVFSRESIFMNTYTAEVDGAKIAFSTTVPGGIVALDMTKHKQGFVFQKGAFLCAEPTVEVKVTFSKKISSGFVGGEGFILQKSQGAGKIFLEVDGDPIVKNLSAGETLKVDTGNVVGFESSVSYDVEIIKGLGNIFLGGEGLFLTKLTGPGKVILQTQNFNDFVGKILSVVPKN